ncbi:MAG: three-Cys-motif partner protein TcmP [Bacteroidota bacterium]
MSEINENIVQEPQNSWGGSWTEKKLDAFAKYVSAYLTIMKKHSYWKTIYFDGFAGSGERKVESNTPLYEQLFIDEPEGSVYKGAAERVLTLQNNLSFDFHYFIDARVESLDKLKNKLKLLQLKNENEFQFKSGDCNVHLLQLSEAMKVIKNKYAALVLLDPFGMQINWESIESLRDTKTDIWILIPTGVIVNRLLDKNCELKHIEKLKSFFGLSEEEIKDAFYFKETNPTLFDDGVETFSKVNKPIEKIASLYAKRLKEIWKYTTEKPLRLENSKGVPIYHFVFASNNESAYKIAKQIILK